MFFDLKGNIDLKSKPNVVALQVARLGERNIRTFQNELEQLQPFLVRCMAKQIPVLTEFMLSLKPEEMTETRRAGLQKARNGLVNAYYNFLQMANSSELKESYRNKVLQAMAETAVQYSSILQLDARRKIFDIAKLGQANAPKTLRVYFKKIVNAMAEKSCEGLCRL